MKVIYTAGKYRGPNAWAVEQNIRDAVVLVQNWNDARQDAERYMSNLIMEDLALWTKRTAVRS